MLIDSGRPTTASYISNTQPIPSNKPEIAACTAMAGEMLGMSTIYLDAGSGAQHSIPASVFEQVASSTNSPIIAGGGINTPEKAEAICEAGADIIVVGNALEKDPSLLEDLSIAIHSVIKSS